MITSLEQTLGMATIKTYNINGSMDQSTTVSNGYLRDTDNIGFALGTDAKIDVPYNGDFYEALVYDRVLTEQEIQSVLSYLKSKYQFLNA
ncbi:hypothetical protein D3C80_1520730 [compost metagenome]